MTSENRAPDRRVIKTKRAIKSAFARLMAERDINDITISDIAALADVNRKTFYNYYAGIYEVVDEIENDIIERFDEVLTEIDFTMNMSRPYMVFEKITAVISTDPEFFGYLMSMNSNVSLTTKLVGMLKAKVKAILQKYITIEESKLDLMLEFMVTGMVAVYQQWYNSDRSEPIEEIGEVINQLSFNGVNGFLDIDIESDG